MGCSTYTFMLDLHSKKGQLSLPVTQGDTNRELRISFSDGVKPYVLGKGSVAMMSIVRPTGTEVQEFCKIEDDGSRVVYPFSQYTCAVPGLHNCEVVLINAEGKQIASPRFSIDAAPKLIDGNDVEIPDEDITAIDAIYVEEAKRQAAETVREEAEAARVAAEAERVTAETGRVAAEAKRQAAIEEIIEVKESIETMRDNGEFDGEDGESGVYILGEDESLDNVPEDVSVVIDPDGEGSADIDLEGVVRYTKQDLTDEQQQQARTNINTWSTEEVGSAVNMATGNSLKWDGVVRDRHFIEGEADFPIGWYHITDEVPTFIEEDGDILAWASFNMISDKSYIASPALPIKFAGAAGEDALLYMVGSMLLIMVVGGNTAGKGVYFSTIYDAETNISGMYISSLQVLGYNFKPQNSELIFYVQDDDVYLYKDIACTQKATINDLAYATVHNVTIMTTHGDNIADNIAWSPIALHKNDVGTVIILGGNMKLIAFYTAEYTETTTTEV